MLKDMTIPCGGKFKFRMIGRSRSANVTYFVLPELKIQLDAGWNDKRFEHMKHVFITHGHGDHAMSLPMVDGTDTFHTQIYVPEEIVTYVKNYIYSLWCLNDSKTLDYKTEYWEKKTFDVNGVSFKTSPDFPILKGRWWVHVLKSFHTVPCNSYCFFQIRNKLKKEYLTKKNQIKKLKKSGVVVTERVLIPKFIFCGDTTIEFFEKHQQYLETHSFPLIIVECTFLYDEHEKRVKEKGHIHWKHLKPVVKRYKKTTFILIHFSLKYTDKEIKTFFDGVKNHDEIENIIPWIN